MLARSWSAHGEWLGAAARARAQLRREAPSGPSCLREQGGGSSLARRRLRAGRSERPDAAACGPAQGALWCGAVVPAFVSREAAKREDDELPTSAVSGGLVETEKPR